MFKQNEGSIDRGLRIVVGIALVAAAASGTLGPWAWLGLIPLATGIVGNCPIYRLLGINTCPRR